MLDKDYISAAKLAFEQNFLRSFHQALEALFAEQIFQSELVFTEQEISLGMKSLGLRLTRGRINQIIHTEDEEEIDSLLNANDNLTNNITPQEKMLEVLGKT